MPQTKLFQNIIIGFGKGGKTLAKTLAAHGETVALIEQSPDMYGGTCVNTGCIPSKSLIVNAGKNIPFAEASAEKNAIVKKLREKNFRMIAGEPNAEVIDGKARFLSDTEIEITSPERPARRIIGKRIFINTGSTPIIPPLPGLKESVNTLTSKEAMELSVLPGSVAVIGAGYVGLEFASMFRRYGSEVTVLDAGAVFLPREDGDVAAAVRKDMENAGIRFHIGVSVSEIKDAGDLSEIIFSDDEGGHSIRARKVLIAVGRKPNTEGLGLENTSVCLTERGAAETDSSLKTSAPNIWAIGDVNGGPQFTYISLDDFRIINSQIFGDGYRNLDNRGVVPYSVFITPPLSRVGLSEKEAGEKGIFFRLFKLETKAAPKAHILNDTRGLFKALVEPVTGEILGACIYAEESHELINLITLAMRAKLSYVTLRDQIYTHPTMSEMFNELFQE